MNANVCIFVSYTVKTKPITMKFRRDINSDLDYTIERAKPLAKASNS